MVWNVFFVFIFSLRVANSMENYYQPPRSSAVWGYFTPPLLQRVPLQSQKTAMEAMVELTNNLGIAILQDHSFSKGNFAFSPYGVASVLVVLYEGSQSESARQIHRAIGFPLNKDIIRVGFRDIHRHLRSYFSHEGYLSGISLNKETSSLKPEYKKILKFYGYDVDLNLTLDDEDDLSSANNSSSSFNQNLYIASPVITEAPSICPPICDNATNPTNPEVDKNRTTVFASSSTTQQQVSEISTSPKSNQTTASPVTTEASSICPAICDNATNPTNPEVDKNRTTVFASSSTTQQQVSETSTSPKSNQTTASPVITEAPSICPSICDNATNPTNPEVDKNRTTVFASSSTTNNNKSVETTMSVITKPPVTVMEAPIPTSTEYSGEVESNETDKPDATELPVSEPQDETTLLTVTEENKLQENITAENNANCEESTACNNNKETITESSIGQTETTSVTELQTEATDGILEEITYPNIDNRMLIPQVSDYETIPVGKDSIRLQSFEETSTTEAFSGVTESEQRQDWLKKDNMSNLVNIKSMINSRASLWLAEKPKKRKIRTITDYLKSPRNPDLSLQLQNGMYDTHVSRNANLYRKLPRLLFLVDGAVDTPVPMMTYTNVFSYAYIPRLHSKALEFPLDDVRYKLLILLPVERRGLRQLIYDLADCPLSNVLDTVRPARVKAVVPTFMVEGFVILTSSLQKLGIWDVFDPRKANLSGMSTDPELYVRNVEQSVTVVIRNYVEILDIQTRTMAARQMEYEFEATHPFVYFVLDTTTNVALMAGQILDPLNSRIY